MLRHDGRIPFTAEGKPATVPDMVGAGRGRYMGKWGKPIVLSTVENCWGSPLRSDSGLAPFITQRPSQSESGLAPFDGR
jgi:hypothetical protein